MPDKRKSFSRGCSRYDDWVCLFCHNHNYSFRTICTTDLIQATAATSPPRTTTPTYSPSSSLPSRLRCLKLPSSPTSSSSWSTTNLGAMNQFPASQLSLQPSPGWTP